MLSKSVFVVYFSLAALILPASMQPAASEGMEDMEEAPFVKLQSVGDEKETIETILSVEFLRRVRDRAGPNLDKFEDGREITHIIIATKPVGDGETVESKFSLIELVGDGASSIEPYEIDNSGIQLPTLWRSAAEIGPEEEYGKGISFEQLDESACVFSGSGTRASGCWKHGGRAWCYQ